MSSMGNFIRVLDTSWVNLDHVTTIKDKSEDTEKKGVVYKILVWLSDNPECMVLKGQDALNVMDALGLPVSAPR